MSIVQATNKAQFSGIATTSHNAARYLPEPATRGVGIFKDVMNLVGKVGSNVVGGVGLNPYGDFAELINIQIEAQREMQTTTMVSNLEKSKHESKMAPIRNIRVS
jgi:hypothetical protein